MRYIKRPIVRWYSRMPSESLGQKKADVGSMGREEGVQIVMLNSSRLTRKDLLVIYTPYFYVVARNKDRRVIKMDEVPHA